MSATAAPGYWTNETSGVLRPAIEAYVRGEPLTPEHILAIRAYLRQWVTLGQWRGPQINALRAGVNDLVDRKTIDAWLETAVSIGIDPL